MNTAEIHYLQQFAATRHCRREQGEFYVNGSWGHDTEGVTHNNEIPSGVPSLWCNFIPSEDGARLEWSGAEKTAEGPQWIRYLINTFLKPNARTSGVAGFESFTFDHIVNGMMVGQGEDVTDRFIIKVKNNAVKVNTVK